MKPLHINTKTIALGLFLAFMAINAQAQVVSADVLDSVLQRYQAAAAGWAGAITSAASFLFWVLVTISMVWTFGMLALKKADIGEFFAEFLRFIMFTGFFWWLLTNGPAMATSIMNGLRQLGSRASGLPSTLSPSGIVDVGFEIFDKVVDQSSFWSPVNSAVGIIIAAIILVILALVAVNMLLLLISGWVLAYGGVFFLGFGGSRWTSDMAINYYKTVLGIAAQLFTMVLIVGIGRTFLDDYYAQMSQGITIKEMGVMLIVAIILLVLTNKLPSLVSGIITGAAVGHAGIGNFGAGAAVGAAGAAAAGVYAGGAMMAAGASQAAGGAQAVMAAFSKASDNVQAGTDVMAGLGGSSGGAGSNNKDSGGDTGATPYAQAAGFASPEKPSPQDGKGKEDGDKGSNATKKEMGGENKGGQQSESSGSGGASNSGGTSDSAAPGSTGPGPVSSVLHAATMAARIAADAGANLASGTASVAKQKASEIKDSTMDRIGQTTGGKIATAIKSMDSGMAFTGNNLSGDKPMSRSDEVAAFVNKDKKF